MRKVMYMPFSPDGIQFKNLKREIFGNDSIQRLRHSVVVTTYPKQSAGAICLSGLLLVATSIWLGSKGPLVAACLASLILIVRSIGFRFVSARRCVPMAAASVTQLGPFSIYHSHYDERQGIESHEFSFRGKFLCAGCYGIAIGTILGLTIPLTYFFNELSDAFYFGLTAIAPFCFLPTIFRCFGWVSLSAVKRFLSYGLLPVGSWIILVQLDRWFQDTLVNLVALFLIFLAWQAGGRYKLARSQVS